MGDAEFFALALGLPHWASKRPCYERDASSSTANQGKYFKILEIDTQAFTRVTHAHALAHPCTSNPLFNAIPGLSTKFVRGDALHICFVHGVYSHLPGSVLHYMCWFNPGRQKIPSGAVSSGAGSLAKGIQRAGQPN